MGTPSTPLMRATTQRERDDARSALAARGIRKPADGVIAAVIALAGHRARQRQLKNGA